MHRLPTIPFHVQQIADRLVDGRRGWSGPLGMTMTAGPGEPDPAAVAAAAAAAETARQDAATAAAAAAAAGAPREATDAEGRRLGFPAETPVEKMTDAQASAYWRNQSRVQERERRAWQDTFGGKKPDEIKAALDAAAAASMSEQEKALAAAKEEGRKEGTQLGVATSAEEAAMLLLETHLENRLPDDTDKDRRKILAESVNIKTAVGEDGKVDPVRVKAIAEALAPNVDGRSGGNSRSRQTSTDVGGGRRGGQAGTGVAAGRDLFAEKRGIKKDDE